MSATGRNLPGHTRFVDDEYETPFWCTELILPHIQSGPIFDPCCGTGAILHVAELAGRDTYGMELNESRASASNDLRITQCADALSSDWPKHRHVVTNPPYSLAMEFIEKSKSINSSFDRAFLLRLNFLGSQKRAAFHKAHPCDIYVLSERPSFCMAQSCSKKCGWGDMIPLHPDGTPRRVQARTCPKCGSQVRNSSSDSCEYGWFVFGPGRGNRWFML